MKKFIQIFALLTFIIIAAVSCKKETEIGSRSQLIGRWQTGQEYIVFYDLDAGDGYAWGKEWNEAQGVYESDLDGEDYHGNGWFKWKKGNDYIRVANMLSISEAASALDWTLYSLSDNEMQLAQKTNQRKTYKKIAKE